MSVDKEEKNIFDLYGDDDDGPSFSSAPPSSQKSSLSHDDSQSPGKKQNVSDDFCKPSTGYGLSSSARAGRMSKWSRLRMDKALRAKCERALMQAHYECVRSASSAAETSGQSPTYYSDETAETESEASGPNHNPESVCSSSDASFGDQQQSDTTPSSLGASAVGSLSTSHVLDPFSSALDSVLDANPLCQIFDNKPPETVIVAVEMENNTGDEPVWWKHHTSVGTDGQMEKIKTHNARNNDIHEFSTKRPGSAKQKNTSLKKRAHMSTATGIKKQRVIELDNGSSTNSKFVAGPTDNHLKSEPNGQVPREDEFDTSELKNSDPIFNSAVLNWFLRSCARYGHIGETAPNYWTPPVAESDLHTVDESAVTVVSASTSVKSSHMIALSPESLMSAKPRVNVSKRNVSSTSRGRKSKSVSREKEGEKAVMVKVGRMSEEQPRELRSPVVTNEQDQEEASLMQTLADLCEDCLPAESDRCPVNSKSVKNIELTACSAIGACEVGQKTMQGDILSEMCRQRLLLSTIAKRRIHVKKLRSVATRLKRRMERGRQEERIRELLFKQGAPIVAPAARGPRVIPPTVNPRVVTTALDTPRSSNPSAIQPPLRLGWLDSRPPPYTLRASRPIMRTPVMGAAVHPEPGFPPMRARVRLPVVTSNNHQPRMIAPAIVHKSRNPAAKIPYRVIRLSADRIQVMQQKQNYYEKPNRVVIAVDDDRPAPGPHFNGNVTSKQQQPQTLPPGRRKPIDVCQLPTYSSISTINKNNCVAVGHDEIILSDDD